MQLNELQQQRLAKAERLRTQGLDPFPTRSHRTHTTAQVLANFDALAHAGKPVTLAGRLMGAMRVFGKLAFMHLADGDGSIQLWLSRGDIGDQLFSRFVDDLDTFDVIQATGTLRRTKKGEPSLFVEAFVPLAKALNPPPEKWEGLHDVELRHRMRYLDLIVNDEVRAVFRARAAAISAVRRLLDAEGFIEVETPVLQPIYGGASARPFITHHHQLDQDLYLRIAPELYLKRLVVGGLERVYEIGKNFRNEGVDRSHNPEFTGLEVYQAYADYHDMMALAERLVVAAAAAVLPGTHLSYRDQPIRLTPPFERVALVEAIAERCGIDITRHTSLETLWDAIRHASLQVERKPTWGKQVDELFSTYVEPTLVQPTFVVDYPLELSPLAKRKPGMDGYVERFELFIGGMELGNAFTELNDPLDQEQRFLEQARARAAGDDEAQEMDADYINALMYGLPPTGGLGIGIDRLVMLLTNQTTIREVVLFPHLRAQEQK